MEWEPTMYQTKSPTGWALVVFFRAQQQGWVFQGTKGSVLHFAGYRHETADAAQRAALRWASTR